MYHLYSVLRGPHGASPEGTKFHITPSRLSESAVVVSGGEFTWGVKEEEEPWVLRDVDLRVEPGQLVAVVGSVGAGKSSLVSALLGEMTKNAGRVIVNVSIVEKNMVFHQENLILDTY